MSLIVLLPLGGCQPRTKKSQEDQNPPANKVEPPKSLSERKANGQVLMYYDNGQIKAERNYKDEKLNGVYRTYYENGQLKVEGNYKDDKMDGVFRHYDQNGQLQTEEVYRDNVPVSRKVLNQ
jgi:antitoxin component YwqK of YwqJK toxin-antitoxin module